MLEGLSAVRLLPPSTPGASKPEFSALIHNCHRLACWQGLVVVSKSEPVIEQAENDVVGRSACVARKGHTHFVVTIADDSLLTPRLLPLQIEAPTLNVCDSINRRM